MGPTAVEIRNKENRRPHDDWRIITSLVLDGISSPHTRRAYSQALDEFLIWFRDDPGRQFNKATVQKYRTELGISRAKGAKRSGVRLGHWLTAEQAEILLAAPDPTTIKGLRDRAVIAILIGAGLRRSELAGLNVDHIQHRESRWLIVNLVGKQGRIRSVPIPSWVHAAVTRWEAAAGLAEGALFRRVTRHGSVTPERISPQAVFHIVRAYSDGLTITVSPHDLRRSFARLAHLGRAPMEQIQLSLGHASVVTTEIYLGVTQNLCDAPCDRLGLVPPDGLSLSATDSSRLRSAAGI
jgi:integrase